MYRKMPLSIIIKNNNIQLILISLNLLTIFSLIGRLWYDAMIGFKVLVLDLKIKFKLCMVLYGSFH